MEEEAQIMLDGERMRRLKESSDWKFAKEKLDKMITIMNSLETLPKNVTATTLQKEIAIRQKAISIIYSWIQEVEGDGEQKQVNSQTIQKINNELVTRFGEE
jgi:hypothetical protein